MAKEIDPKSTTRAKAFEFWMQAPNPMVTFFKTLNVTKLVKASKKHGLKFNMLMDYCIRLPQVHKNRGGKLPGLGLVRYELPISFQFHHTQMDGAHAGKFLANLQKAIDELR
ncbi:hypothetical protein [Fibrobacter sp. UBA4297]|uniref:hypothetical protein n=1 Tax=Fibrobacter sp. UBA4297 TaxID=1946536 RepID=UPI0025C1AFC2|nr:hypothetical protein [Fibrobacter sp. UBA4297]